MKNMAIRLSAAAVIAVSLWSGASSPASAAQPPTEAEAAIAKELASEPLERRVQYFRARLQAAQDALVEVSAQLDKVDRAAVRKGPQAEQRRALRDHVSVLREQTLELQALIRYYQASLRELGGA